MKKYFVLFIVLLSLIVTSCSIMGGRQKKTPNQEPSQERKEEYKEVFQEETKVDKQAMYPGGNEGISLHIRKNLRFPSQAAKENIKGLVKVKYTIGVDGSVKNIEVIEAAHISLGQEAIRVLKGLDKWIPAYIGRKPVEVSYMRSFSFE